MRKYEPFSPRRMENSMLLSAISFGKTRTGFKIFCNCLGGTNEILRKSEYFRNIIHLVSFVWRPAKIKEFKGIFCTKKGV